MRRRRGGSRVLRVLGWLLLAGLVIFVLPVALLRFLPAPTSAFMLASDTRPVRHTWIAAAQIPATARRAVVASEDQKFFEHRGFDVEAIQKAYANNRKARRIRGGSTISQQTAKNLFLWSGGGYARKGIEAIYTVLIEALWPKQRILTVYLNIVEFGPGIYGVEAAARAFFNKPAAALTSTEAARLAAVLPNPTRWSAARPGPYVQKRTAWILRQMGAAARATAPRPPAAAPAPPTAEEPEPIPDWFDRDEPPPAEVTPRVPSPAAEPPVTQPPVTAPPAVPAEPAAEPVAAPAREPGGSPG